MLCSPLAMTNDLRHLGQAEKRILLNKEIIAINQDPLGRQAERKLKTDVLQVFVKPLAEGKWAIALLNTGDKALKHHQNFANLGLEGKYKVRNVWTHQDLSRKAT
jgi:alpha-galactosidase